MNDPREILKSAGVECAEVDDWPLAIATIKAHTGYPNMADAMNDAILALSRLVAKYKWQRDFAVDVGEEYGGLDFSDLDRDWERRHE